MLQFYFVLVEGTHPWRAQTGWQWCPQRWSVCTLQSPCQTAPLQMSWCICNPCTVVHASEPGETEFIIRTRWTSSLSLQVNLQGLCLLITWTRCESGSHAYIWHALPHENWPVLNNYLNTWTAVTLPPTRACVWWRLTCTLLSLTATDVVIIGISAVSSQNAKAQAKCLLCWVPY